MDVDNTDIDLISCKFRTMNTNDKDFLINEFKRLSNTQLSTEGCCFYLDLAEWNLNSALWAYYEYETAGAGNNNNNNNNNNSVSNNNNNNNNNTSVSSNNSSNHFLNSSSSNQHNSSYLDYSNPNELPEMQFVCDITIGEGESVAPNSNFLKTWRIKNTGNKRWPAGCTLKYVNGYNFTSSSSSSSSSSSAAVYSSSTSSSSSSSSDLLTNGGGGEIQSPVEIELRELETQETLDLSISLQSPAQCGIYQCQYRAYTRYNQPFGDPIWLLLNVEIGGVLGITQQLNNVNVFGGVNINNNQINHHHHHHQQASSTNELNKHFFTNTNAIVNGRLKNEQQQQQQPPTTLDDTDEKRPDFYDDMFS